MEFCAASIGGYKGRVADVVGRPLLGMLASLAVAANWGCFASSHEDAVATVVLPLRSDRLAPEERAS